MSETGLELHSTISADGVLTLSLAQVATPQPADDEVVIKMEAAPLNPSDMALLTRPADLTTGRTSGSGVDTVYKADIPAALMPTVQARINIPVPVGNEGAGVVVRAGKSDAAQALLGRTVAAVGGAMYCQYRCMNALAVVPLHEGTTARQGASCFVNPMTALSMVEVMRSEGFKGLVHTAAASNLGQMLNRICIADGIPLVNIVRRDEQAQLLTQLGGKYVVNSSSETYHQDLVSAISDAEAYLCFDAIGGGTIADEVLTAMEAAATQGQGSIGPYGSDIFKQVYVYGGLSEAPTTLGRSYGFHWGISAWLTSPFLAKAGTATRVRLQQRVLSELDTTFASDYQQEVSLSGALQAENVAIYGKQSTGEKFLINPSIDD